MDTKKDVRSRVRARRKALGAPIRQEYSARISAELAPLLRKVDGYVFCYLSYASEVDTSGVITWLLANGVKVCVPTVTDGVMRAVCVDETTLFADGRLGISEPTSGKEVLGEEIGLVLAPLVAFDERGNRLGQGGGYYDRFVTSQAFRVGLAFSCQQDEFPVEDFDVKLDAVVTEQGVRFFNEDYRRKIQG